MMSRSSACAAVSRDRWPPGPFAAAVPIVRVAALVSHALPPHQHHRGCAAVACPDSLCLTLGTPACRLRAFPPVSVTVRDMDLRSSLKTSNIESRHRSRSSMVEQSSAEERSTVRFPAAPSFRVQQVYPDIRESKAREHAEARQAAIIRMRLHNNWFRS